MFAPWTRTTPAISRAGLRLAATWNPRFAQPATHSRAPERWIEALSQEAPDRLDATLDPGHLYAQVPAMAAGDRDVIDLLGITRRGRLVVIELKAAEDILLPIQAIDDWLRVRRHQKEGNFERYGYSSGTKIDPALPFVWSVAPGLRIHPATEILDRRIGLKEDWRRGIKVLFRSSRRVLKRRREVACVRPSRLPGCVLEVCYWDRREP